MLYIVYTKENCKWCNLVKSILTESNLPFEEKKYGVDFSKVELQQLLAERFNSYLDKITLPQIFQSDGYDIYGYIGIFEDLEKYLSTEREI